MKRPKNKRKSYFKRYYETKIKPFRDWSPATLWHQCLFCGMMTRKERFEDEDFREFEFKSYQRWGRRFEFHMDPIETQEYLRLIKIRVLNFLKNCISRGLTTREEIIEALDLAIERDITSAPSFIYSSVSPSVNSFAKPEIILEVRSKTKSDVKTFGYEV